MSENLLFWLIVVVALVVAELVTFQLVAIWPAIGGVVAMLAASFHQSLLTQFLLFSAVSFVLLLLTRPLVRRLIRQTERVSTNADRLIGKQAVVCERIDNLAETGAVVVSGVTWMARSETGSPIPAGETVHIRQIEGAKLIVSVE